MLGRCDPQVTPPAASHFAAISFAVLQRPEFVRAVRDFRVVVFGDREPVEAGGVMSCGTDPRNNYRRYKINPASDQG
jgi:hypothetical protein